MKATLPFLLRPGKRNGASSAAGLGQHREVASPLSAAVSKLISSPKKHKEIPLFATLGAEKAPAVSPALWRVYSHCREMTLEGQRPAGLWCQPVGFVRSQAAMRPRIRVAQPCETWLLLAKPAREGGRSSGRVHAVNWGVAAWSMAGKRGTAARFGNPGRHLHWEGMFLAQPPCSTGRVWFWVL